MRRGVATVYTRTILHLEALFNLQLMFQIAINLGQTDATYQWLHRYTLRPKLRGLKRSVYRPIPPLSTLLQLLNENFRDLTIADDDG